MNVVNTVGMGWLLNITYNHVLVSTVEADISRDIWDILKIERVLVLRALKMRISMDNGFSAFAYELQRKRNYSKL